jgi:ABC-type bacteriocin/lantibiotic exporter with double-glycine peptidase domain
VLVGQSPPADNVSSQAIQQVTVTNAEWLRPSLLEINPGFVAVIGARGSDKTALADLLLS